MAKFLSGIVMMLALSGLSLAQSTTPAPPNQGTNNAAQAESSQTSIPATPRIAPGSVIPVQLTTTVDAKKAKTGEPVTAKVTQDLKASNGMMLLPKDTQIVGHVTEAQAKNKQDKESQVGIVFDHAVTQSGNISYPLSIQAVISPQVFQNHPSSGDNGAAGAPSPSESGQMPSGQMPGGSSRGNMGGGQSAPPSGVPSGGTAQSSGANAPPRITGQTQGVVGFSHLKLETPTKATDPSVISSEKSNVKLENGTLMLLRVNQ